MKALMLLVLTSLCGVAIGSRGMMKITKVMLADASDNLVAVGDGRLTNMDSSLHIWYYEIPSDQYGATAAANNRGPRWYVCSLDGAAWTTCGDRPDLSMKETPTKTVGGLKRYAVGSRLREGKHEFLVRAATKDFDSEPSIDFGALESEARDLYSFVGPASKWTFEIDASPPVVTIDEHWAPADELGAEWQGYSVDGTVDYATQLVIYEATNRQAFDRGKADLGFVKSRTFMATFAANEGSILKFECKLDDYDPVPCNKQTVLDGGAVDGTATVSIGLTGYMLDGQEGLVYIEGIPSNGTARPAPAPNGGAVTSAHVLRVRATDEAGNVGDFSAPREWVIDMDPARTIIDRRNLVVKQTTETAAMFSFDSFTGGLFYECQVECLGEVQDCDQPGKYLPCVSPVRVVLDETLLVQGPRRYMFSVRATDAANNIASCAEMVDALETTTAVECPSYTWTIDISIPTTDLAVRVDPSSAGSYNIAAEMPCPETVEGLCVYNGGAIGFMVSADSAEVSSVYECQLDSPEWFVCGIGGDTRIGSPAHVLPFRSARLDLKRGQEIFSKLPDGPHYFRCRTTNAHKTTSKLVEFEWYADTNGPVATLTEQPPSLTTSTTAAFRFDVFPKEPASFQCRLDDGGYFDCDDQLVVVGPAGSSDNVAVATTTTTITSAASASSSASGGTNEAEGWTDWIDADQPDGVGQHGGDDIELSICPSNSATPGDFPWAIECRVQQCSPTLDGGAACTELPWDQGGQDLATPCTLRGGLQCRHSDQSDGRLCLNYQVRLRCGDPVGDLALALVNAASSFELYVDGIRTAAADDWTLSKELYVSRTFQVVAVRATNFGDGTLAGILVSMPTLGLASDSSWKCSSDEGAYSASTDWTQPSFNDVAWDDAYSKGYVGQAPWGVRYLSAYSARPSPHKHLASAQWIWARADQRGRNPNIVFCRIDNPEGRNSTQAVTLERTLGNGKHTFMVKATDEAGNVQDPPTSCTWEVDAEPPVVDLFSTPVSSSNSDSGSSDSGTDSGGVGSIVRVADPDAEFRFRVASAKPQLFRGYTVLPAFRAQVDGTILNGLYCPPGSYLCGEETCRVATVCDSDLDDGVALDNFNASCAAILDAGCDRVGARTSPLSLLDLGHGTHELVLWAVDTMGNVGPEVQFEWIVDVRAPVAVITSSPEGTGGRPDSGPTNADIFQFGYSTNPDQISRFECAAGFECTIFVEGTSVADAEWAACTSDASKLCQAKVGFSVELLGSDKAWSAQMISLVGDIVVSALKRSNLSPTPNAVLAEATTAGARSPLTLVHTGGLLNVDGSAGARFAGALLSQNRVFLTANATLAECQAICIEELLCDALYHRSVDGACYGLTGINAAETVAEPVASSCFVRRSGATTVPSVSLHFHVDTRPYVGKVDMLAAVSGEVVKIIESKSLNDAISGTNEAKFANAGLVTATLRVGGGLAAAAAAASMKEDLPGAVLSAVITVAGGGSNDMDVDVVSITGVHEASSDALIRIRLKKRSAEAAVLAAFNDAVSTGTLMASLRGSNPSAYDIWAVQHVIKVDHGGSDVGVTALSIAQAIEHVLDLLTNQTSSSVLAGVQTSVALGTVMEVSETSTTFRYTVVGGLDGGSRLAEQAAKALVSVLQSPGHLVIVGEIVAEGTAAAAAGTPPPTITSAEAPIAALQVGIAAAPGGEPARVPLQFALGTDVSLTRTDVPQTTDYYHSGSSECENGGIVDASLCIGDGTYTFGVRVTDTHGNVGNPTSRQLVVDSVPPTLAWKQGPPAVLNARNGLLARFDFQSNEVDIEGRETSSFQCRLERGLGSAPDDTGLQFEDCGALPVVYPVRTGMYTFFVRPTDAAGNMGATYVRQFEVDATAPTADIEAGYLGPYTQDGKLRLDLNQTEPGIFWCTMEVGDCIVNNTCNSGGGDGNSNVVGSTGGTAAGYEVCSESVLIEAMPAVVAAGGIISDPPTMYRLRVLLEDLSGNLQDVPNVAVWTADSVAPRVNITTASRPLQLSARANPEIFFDVLDELAYRADIPVDVDVMDPSDVLSEEFIYSAPVTDCLLLTMSRRDDFLAASLEVQAQWGGWEPCASPFQVQASSGRALFLVRATDAAGNVGAIDRVAWIIDGEAPKIERRGAPPAASVRDEKDMVATVFAAQKGVPAPVLQTQGAGNAANVDLTAARCVSGDSTKNDGEAEEEANGAGAIVVATATLVKTGATELTITVKGLESSSLVDSGPVTLRGPAGIVLHAVGVGSSAGRTLVAESTWENVQLDAMRMVMGGLAYIEIAGSDNSGCLVRSAPFTLLFDAYLEFYATFTLDDPAGGGEYSRLQCCLDNECDSPCRYCHAAGGGTMCSTDCGSADRRLATQCNCDTVPGYANWPQGYDSKMVSTDFTALSRVEQGAWDAAEWPCTQGGKHVAGLREGVHEFGARAVDQGLHTSGEPLLYTWTIDATPPVSGILRFPDPVVATMPTVAYHADEAGVVVGCTVANANGVVTPCGTGAAAGTATAGSSDDDADAVAGEHTMSIQATDAAGNPGAILNVGWEVDDDAPVAELVEIQTIGGVLLAAAVTEPGAAIECSLNGTADADGSPVSLSGCNHPIDPDHYYCPELTIIGTAGAAGAGASVVPAGVVGPYIQKWCPQERSGNIGVASAGSHASSSSSSSSSNSSSNATDAINVEHTSLPDLPCMSEGRPVYEHRDSRVELRRQGPLWLLLGTNNTVLGRVRSAVSVPEEIVKGARWLDADGAELAPLSIACATCHSCGRISYRGLAGGSYTLCVAARDRAGNLGNASCSEKVDVVTALQQQASLEASALASLQVCNLAEKEWPIAMAAIIGFGIFVVVLSIYIYFIRKQAAIALANQQKTDAILTSTVGFKEAQFQNDEMQF